MASGPAFSNRMAARYGAATQATHVPAHVTRYLVPLQGSQKYGPILVPLDTRCRCTIYSPKGPMALRLTHKIGPLPLHTQTDLSISLCDLSYSSCSTTRCLEPSGIWLRKILGLTCRLALNFLGIHLPTTPFPKSPKTRHSATIPKHQFTSRLHKNIA